MTDTLLAVEDLQVEFKTSEGTATVVDGVSFSVNKGETLGIVGESGCGKSVTSLSIMRLLPTPPGNIAGGRIVFQGQNLLDLSEHEMCGIRGHDISMIFQEPMTSLNPVYTIGQQISEAIRAHKKISAREARSQTVKMLEMVGIPEPAQRVSNYPHQLSGGMRQRAMIAMALSLTPKLLIADEPTTALDVTIQAQILELMRRIKEEMDMAIILITHDLGVIAEVTKRVMVMYAGTVVEEALVDDLFLKPYHPYTEGLLASIPQLNSSQERLHVIEGMVPHALQRPRGCRFAPRCPYAEEICQRTEPALLAMGGGRSVRCWKYKNSPQGGE
ncbi:MAG: ABC transporter ATP-binding protein [Eubacteriales bacterium]|nr:ABC transporter ATP-binding protein [Eubacteriales bacterium]MDD3073212.1 ABC transporter ATP-binding protein [Eubacteriales bacterium]MDD4769089.1 ABC transporter ATP-binding protein [Eubacteriales bacterium]